MSFFKIAVKKVGSNDTYNASLANTSYVSDRIINESVAVPNLKEYYTSRGEDLRHINHTADGKIATPSGSISYLEYLPYIQILQQQNNNNNKPQTPAQTQHHHHHHQPQQAHIQNNHQQQHQQANNLQTISQMHQVNQKPTKSRKKTHQNQIRIPNYDGIDPTTSSSGNVTTTSGQANSNRSDILQGSTKRLYFCPLCNKMFKWARNLKRHQIVHTGEEPYKCTKCRRSFKTNYRRKLHEKMPHPLRYGCTLCLNQFLKEGELKTHLKNHHGISD